jgi:hypothetical protein
MWEDLQQSAWIALAPFILYILLPGFVGAGMLMAIHDALAVLFGRDAHDQ